MTTRFHSENVWPTITAAVKNSPDTCLAAVAYFGSCKLLPLTEGSTLVVDMSETAVRSGQTNPSEILKLVNRGVDVHSVKNLHAKIFVIDNKVFVGSANVSQHSADGLLEAIVQTDNRNVVSACRRYVESLRGELVTPEYARRMMKVFRPPQFGNGQRRTKHQRSDIPQHSRLWVVPLVYVTWDKQDYQERDEGLPAAKTRLRSTKRFRVQEFCWTYGNFPDRLKENDLIIQAFNEGHGKIMVAPASRVINIRRYKKGRAKHAIVFLERAKSLRQKNLIIIESRIGPRARELGKIDSPQVQRDRALVHALLNLWPTGDSE